VPDVQLYGNPVELSKKVMIFIEDITPTFYLIGSISYMVVAG
jgi:hypothetical protein